MYPFDIQVAEMVDSSILDSLVLVSQRSEVSNGLQLVNRTDSCQKLTSMWKQYKAKRANPLTLQHFQ